MKVYVCYYEDQWEYSNPFAVFSTEKEAKKYCRDINNYANDYDCFEVDIEVPNET